MAAEHSGKSSALAEWREFDLFEFARAGRQAAGVIRVSQLPRMLNEVAAEAPDRDTAFEWHAQGSIRPELQADGAQGRRPWLQLELHGAAWLECQRCLAPYEQAFDVEATYRIVETEAEAEAFPLDEDDVDVIVGSHQFDLVDLIEDELLLALPLVPKHDVCPQVHESLVSGASGEAAQADGAGEQGGQGEDVGQGGKPNLFASLEALKRKGPGTH